MRQIDAVEHNLPAARRFKTCVVAESIFHNLTRPAEPKISLNIDSQTGMSTALLPSDRLDRSCEFQKRRQRFTGFHLRAVGTSLQGALRLRRDPQAVECPHGRRALIRHR